MIVRSFSTQLVSLLGMFCAVACASAGPESGGEAQSNVNAACTPESEDGAEDKIHCASDGDCDSDEVCVNAKCTGLDGDVEDEADCGESEDEADDADEADDEGGADKIYCATDADCDSDEVCVNGKCDG